MIPKSQQEASVLCYQPRNQQYDPRIPLPYHSQPQTRLEERNHERNYSHVNS